MKRRHGFLYELGSVHEQSRTDDLMLCSRYQLVRKLGEGGMGCVWLAYDTSLDNRKVAIKLLPVDLLQNSHALWQQKNEARLSLRLSHPNIATTRVFEIDHDIPFLVMDYVPGVTLAQVLAQGGPISEAQAFELFAPLAEALDYAHSQGVIHRDIKPSNILISETRIPFLADFGIASETRDAVKDQVSIAGTLPYMSPEQLLGNPPSESQDIYSFGATIYQCLVGHPPFDQGDMAYQILHRDPVPLACSCCFCRRIMLALAKVGSKRPAKARQIADAASRLQSFTRWVMTQAEEVFDTHILSDGMAVARLEYAAAKCLKELISRGSAQINLPFFRGPDAHFVLNVSWDDVRKLYW